MTDVLGITRRTTFNKAKRAYAYDFPLDAFGRGGRPSKDRGTEPAEEAVAGDGDEEQRLDTVAEEDEDDSLGRTETWRSSEPESAAQSMSVSGNCEDQDDDEDCGNDELQEHLQQAIGVLQAMDEVL